MNLSAYDNIKEATVYNTWIDSRYRRLYSREIKYYPYYCLLKRFEPKLGRETYYLCLSAETDDGHEWHSTAKYGNSVKIPLNEVWDKLMTKATDSKTTYIVVDVDYKDSNSIIYLLAI